MEVSSSLQEHLGDSFSHGWLKQAPPSPFAADAGSSRRSFVDMDDADLFSMRWTTESNFDFGLQSVPGSPTQLASASKIFCRGRLLPSDSVGAATELDALVGLVPGVPWTSASSSPLFHSAQSTPLSLSACSSAASNHPTMSGERRVVSWKVVVLRYVRFLIPLYRKARSLASAPRHKHARVAPAASSPGRGSTATATVDWCHDSADTAVRDAILYCKKSSGQDALP